MEFQLYPMDIQICPIYIESFSYSNTKVRLKSTTSGVKLNPELKLLQYNLGQPLQMDESDGYMPEKDGNFSRLTVYFRFERQIGHHLIQTFAPSSLVVMLSWFSFWLGELKRNRENLRKTNRQFSPIRFRRNSRTGHPARDLYADPCDNVHRIESGYSACGVC